MTVASCSKNCESGGPVDLLIKLLARKQIKLRTTEEMIGFFFTDVVS